MPDYDPNRVWQLEVPDDPTEEGSNQVSLIESMYGNQFADV